jgi:hypothetical protein
MEYKINLINEVTVDGQDQKHYRVDITNEDGTFEHQNLILLDGMDPDEYFLDGYNKVLTPNLSNYASKRAAEYPSIQDQLDTLYHEGFDSWKSQIKAIKDKYPKS